MTFRLAVFGDSIAYGLGVRGRQYGQLVADALGAQVVDVTGSAQQIDHSLAQAQQMGRCDVVILHHGVSEALLRPGPAALRLVPARWRRPGWLDPRPYFSQRPIAGFAQRIESTVRWRTKVQLMRRFPTEQWMSPARYHDLLARFVEIVDAESVLVVGGAQIDERYFPGSQLALDSFSALSRQVCGQGGATYVDAADVCERWDHYFDDHFHPNGVGHEQIASAVLAHLGA